MIINRILIFCSVFILMNLIIAHLYHNAAKELKILPNKYDLKLLVDSEGKGKGKLDINFNLTDKTSFIKEYEISIPVKRLIVSSVLVNNQNVRYNILKNENDEFANLKIYFDTKDYYYDIKIINIQINFNSNDVFTKDNVFKYFLLPAIFPELNDNKNITISFSKNLGHMNIYNNKDVTIDETENTYILSNFKDKSALILFGQIDKFSVKSVYDLVLEKIDKTKKIILNLFGQFEDVKYKKLNLGDYGVYNKYGNEYIIIENISNDQFIIEADIYLNKNKSRRFIDIKYDITPDIDSYLYQEIKDYFEKENNFFKRLSFLNDNFKKILKPNKILKVDWNNEEDIWKKLNTDNASLNSFEICYAQTAILQKFSIKANIYYGYLIFPRFTDFDKSNPHIWCTFSDGVEIIKMDTFLESMYKIDYFDFQLDDRLTFGIAHPSFIYDPIFGLRNMDSEPVKLYLQNLKYDDDSLHMQNSSLNGILSISSPVYSGEYFVGTLEINNLTQNFVRFDTILINKFNKIENLFVHVDLSYGLIPLRKNIIKINNLKEYNIFFEGLKDIEVDIQNGNESIVKVSTKVEFIQNKRSIYVIFIALSAFFTLLIYVVYYFFKIRKIYKIK